MNRSKSKIISAITAILLTSLPVQAEEKIDGHWEGNLSVMGNDLKILVDIKSEKNNVKATIDIPQQGAKGLVLENIEYHEPKIHLELDSPIGKALMDGQIDKDIITGDFQQGGYLGKFNLERKDITAQAQPEKLPYREENVSFKNGDVTLAGTLSLPEKKGNYPAVIMITGSGSQNRDEDILGFKIFKIIADHLTKRGIAVLRYDDRGFAQSKGGDPAKDTSEDFTEDTSAAVNFLLNHGEINKAKIGLFGHSEGGMIAPMVAQNNKNVAFMVLMAGPSETGEKILLDQSSLILKANGSTDKEVSDNRVFQNKLFKAMRTDSGWDTLEQELKKQVMNKLPELPAELRKKINDPEEYAETYAAQTLQMYRTNWFKYFVNYDPSPVLQKTTIPVLALFGEKDLQVPAVSNTQVMETALKKANNKKYVIKTFPNANHLFQSAKTGSPSEYGSLNKEFVPGFLDTISDWIIKTTK